MKRIILGLIAILFYTTNSFSYENQPVEKKYYAYCIVYTTQVDFGLSEDYWLEQEPNLRNKKGKLVRFRSLVDVLNYMGALGWEVVQTYSSGGSISKSSLDSSEATISSSAARLLRKEVEKGELDQINAAIREKF